MYNITATDENEEKPFNPKEKNQLMYSLVEAPKEATLNTEGRLMWEPTKEQIGKNNFIISVSDSLESVQQKFSIFVNDKPNYVHCAGGYRSVIAASILKARGYNNLVDVAGGFGAIKNTDLPLTDFVCPSTL